MSDDSAAPPSEGDLVARWQYAIVWRYGALLLILVGLGMIACAMAGATAVSPDALLPTGLAALLSGVVLPRVKGRFSGPGQVAADLLPLHEIDARPQFRYRGPIAAPTKVVEKALAVSGHGQDTGSARVITVGDVVRALQTSPRITVTHGVDGEAIYGSPYGDQLELLVPAGRSIADEWAEPADSTLLDIVRRWGVELEGTGRP